MKIAHLDHFTIVAQPAEIEQLREFYCTTLGLEPGARPDFPFPGYWLYPAGGGPIVHLAGITGRAPPEGPRDTGKLDHVSFREGLAECLPVEDGWADAVISNGVFNLCADKRAVFAEVWRALRPGGVLQFADIASGKPVPEEAVREIDLWTG